MTLKAFSKIEMLKVRFPADNVEERTYILQYLFSILGHQPNLEPDETVEHYHIKGDSEKELIIEDHFFKHFPEDLSYLSNDALPKTCFSCNYEENDYIGIFGSGQFEISESITRCGLDIFASSFFMLTRWEEVLCDKYDEHDRCPDEAQFAIQQDFYDRPVVNEYIQLLSKLLRQIGFESSVNKSFKYIWTSDLEYHYKYRNFIHVLRSVFGSVLKRLDFGEALINFREGLIAISEKEQDPYYKGLRFLSENLNSKAGKLKLYLIPSRKGEKDWRYKIDDCREYLKALDLNVGIHPSYSTFLNEDQFEEELLRMKELGYEVEEGRQHFFRFRVPDTWNMWNKYGLKKDSTLGFTENAGFRAGICYAFPVFNVKTRRQLQLTEQPCIIMDVALWKQCPKERDFAKVWNDIEAQVKKHHGELCVLWHPNNVNHGVFRLLFPFLKAKLEESQI